MERISEDTSFCSRCGYLLTRTAELLVTDGVPSADLTKTKTSTPRLRGLKQGFFLILLAVILSPVLGIILRFGFNMIPWPMGVFIFLVGGGGLLRIIYALMFESGQSDGTADGDRSIAAGLVHNELPAGDTSSYISPQIRPGGWLDTNDLEPRSVTDATTRLLEKEDEP